MIINRWNLGQPASLLKSTWSAYGGVLIIPSTCVKVYLGPKYSNDFFDLETSRAHRVQFIRFYPKINYITSTSDGPMGPPGPWEHQLLELLNLSWGKIE